jgi:hypothetical protein
LKLPNTIARPERTTRVVICMSQVRSACFLSAGEKAFFGVTTSSPISQSRRRPWMPLESSPFACQVASLEAPWRLTMIASSRHTFSSGSGKTIGLPSSSAKSAASCGLFSMCQEITERLAWLMPSSSESSMPRNHFFAQVYR